MLYRRGGGDVTVATCPMPPVVPAREVIMSEHGLQVGTVDVRSAGPITFGPAGILFLADNASAKVFAIDVSDPGAQAGSEPFDLANVDARISSFLGCDVADLAIRDMAVHPVSHNVYLSVQRGRGVAS